MAVSNNKRIAKNTLILTFQQVISLIVALYTSRVILQSLGVEDFGIYNVIAGFVTMFAFLNISMNNAVQRFYNVEYAVNGIKGAKMVFNNSLFIQFVLALIILLLLETIGLWYVNNELIIPEQSRYSAVWVYQFSSISLLFVVMQIPFSAAIAAHEKMVCFASVSILDSFLKLLVAIVINHISGDRLFVYGFLILLISIFDFVIYFIYSIRHFKEIAFDKICNWIMLKQMLAFSGWNCFGSFAGVTKEQGVNVILNLFFGPLVNAARGIAYQVAGAMKSFVSTVMISGRPQLMQSFAQNNNIRTIELMYNLSKASFLILFFFSLPVMCNIECILRLWLGVDMPNNTGIFVNLVIVMSLIETFSSPISFVVHASGRMTKYQLINSSIILIILPVSYVILKLGANAVSVFWMGVIFQFLCQISSLLILKEIITYSILDYMKKVVVPLLIVVVISSFIVLFASYLLKSEFVRLIATTIVSIFCIMLTSYLFVLNKDGRTAVRAIFNNAIRQCKDLV